MYNTLPDEISRWLDRAPGRSVRISQISDHCVVHLIEMRRWPPWSPREQTRVVAWAVGPSLSEALHAAARHPRITEEASE